MVPTLKHVVVLRDKGGDLPMTPGRDHDWRTITAEAPTSFDPVVVDADDPLMVVFTSGTTAFRPRQVVFVDDLPKTRNMKIMRRVVRATISGQPAGDLSNLVNPEAVDELKRVLTHET